MRIVPVVLSGMLVLAADQVEAVGFQRVRVSDPHNVPIEVGIWYPSGATGPAEINTPFRQSLALDRQAGKEPPLVVVWQGSGGWIGGHAGTALALAEAGFVVAAPARTGHHSEDERFPPARWMIERPRHTGLVLDRVPDDWSGHDRIDPNATGIFGFSAGGYTALVAIRAVPNRGRIAPHCASHPAEQACRIGKLPVPARPRVSSGGTTIGGSVLRWRQRSASSSPSTRRG